MPSSTSSSEVFSRDIPSKSWAITFILTMVLFVFAIAGWESYWRSEGAIPSFINSDNLWAMERRKVKPDSVVFTGSSRVLFGLQTDVWQQETGVKPIQLALEGSSPLSILENLSDDKTFHGTVFSGVAPGLFFSGFEYRDNALKTYLHEQPSHWLGQQISMLIEPYLAFMDPDFSLFTVIKRQPWPEREGVKTFLDVRMLNIFDAERNTQMWDKVVSDEDYRKLAIKIWMEGFVPIEERDKKWIEKSLGKREKQIQRAVKVAEKFKANGAKLIFVRMPEQGFYSMRANMYNPRQDAWDVLIKKTGARGINFKDFEQLSKYTLPEESHLNAMDARTFTKDLALIHKNMSQDDNETAISAQ